MTQYDRRKFLKGMSLGAGAALLTPLIHQLDLHAAAKSGQLPRRFVFVMKSSGIIPESTVPPGLKSKITDKSRSLSLNLDDQPLVPCMKALEPFKDQLSMVQGISGKMCRGGHSSWFGALGVYKTGGEFESGVILRATADARLAQLHPAPFNHVGLALRGKVMSDEMNGTLYPGISAVGPNAELPFEGSPDLAYQSLFGSAVSNSKQAAKRYLLQKNLLDFMVDDIKKLDKKLPGTEREKMNHYLNAFEELQVRRSKLAVMKDKIKENAPEFSDKFTSNVAEVRQEAHSDLIAAALIAGLTNTVTFRLDNISTYYNTLGLRSKSVHGIGHKEVADGIEEPEARKRIRTWHFELLANIAKKLKAVPEGNGTMLDNTMIVYMSDSGDAHHGQLHEWPMIVLGGCAGKMKLPGKYIQLPEYGKEGHQTLGNWWTSVLNAYGDPVKHYGNLDLTLKQNGMKQEGPIAHLIS